MGFCPLIGVMLCKNEVSSSSVKNKRTYRGVGHGWVTGGRERVGGIHHQPVCQEKEINYGENFLYFCYLN